MRRGAQGVHGRKQRQNPQGCEESEDPASDLVRADFDIGGAKGTRTPDLLVANETRYQLRHSPAETGRADQHRDFTTSGGGGLLRFCQFLAGRLNQLDLGGRRCVGRDRNHSAR